MEILYRIWLAQKSKLKKDVAGELLRKAGSAKNAYEADREYYINNIDCSEGVIEQLLDKSLDEAKEIVKKCEELDIQILTPDDEYFPSILNELDEPVLVLYAKGIIPKWENTLKLAMVGTRDNSEYGEVVATRFAGELAREGVIIISGMAKGIDGISMRSAFKNNGFVIGVMGRGLDEAYPKRNSDIFENICKYGCAISEYPPGVGAFKTHFPERNRIVSALSDGVLAVECPLKSGTMITAGFAEKMGKKLFAVPGNIYSKNCEGPNYLLKTSAVAVTAPEDILEEFPQKYNTMKRINTVINNTKKPIIPVEEADSWVDDPVDKEIIGYLKASDMSIEELSEKSGYEIKTLNSHLTILEVEGIVIKLAGARYRYNTEN